MPIPTTGYSGGFVDEIGIFDTIGYANAVGASLGQVSGATACGTLRLLS